MAAPSPARNDEQSGPLDVVLRYGVLLAIATYAVGLLIEWTTASRLGLALADFPLTDRRILVAGGALLLEVAFCIGLSACILSVLSREQTSSRLSVLTGLLVPPIFWSALWLLRVYVASPDHMNWKFMVYAVVLSWAGTWTFLSFCEVFPPLPRLRQSALLVLILVSLVLLSFQSGDLTAEALLRGPKVRLLVSLDNVAGARQLGISFPETRDGSPAQLSEEVRIVYVGERTVLLQLENGRIVQYSRDNIAGAVRY